MAKDVPSLLRRYAWPFVTVTATVVAMQLWRDELYHVVGPLFLVPVYLSAVRGGMGPGVLATVLAVCSANLFVLESRSLLPADFEQGTEELLYVLVALAVSWLAARQLRAREELRASETRLRDLAESIPHLVWAMRVGEHPHYLNRRALDYFGKTSEEIRESGWMDAIHPDDRGPSDDLWRRAMAEDVEFRAEFRLRHAPSGEYYWHACHGVPIHDADGHVTGWYVTATNVHDRMLAERELQELNQNLEARVAERTAELIASQEALRQAERLAAIGEMMTGLSHESRNALQRSSACLEMLAKRLRDHPELEPLLAEARRAQEDLRHVYQEVQDYARPLVLDRRPTDVAYLWRSAWQKLAPLRNGRDATLREHTDGQDRECWVDAFYLEQVFRNLLENSLAACGHEAEITIACSSTVLTDQPALRIVMRDNGPGLPPEARDRVFQPFFTTKTKGTGLGLSIVRRIVEAHGGTVQLESPDDGGLQVVIDIPKRETA